MASWKKNEQERIFVVVKNVGVKNGIPFRRSHISVNNLSVNKEKFHTVAHVHSARTVPFVYFVIAGCM